MDISKCKECRFCKDFSDTKCRCVKLHKVVTERQTKAKCPLIPRDYYSELSIQLDRCESSSTYRRNYLDEITHKVDWCWKFRHITEKQLGELADRVVHCYNIF